MTTQPVDRVNKMKTGIRGFDLISNGGLPIGRTTLVSGTAGSAKTILGAQVLAEGIRQFDQAGVFVTFEESPNDIRRNMAGFGWDIARWEDEGKWAFVDVSPEPGHEQIVGGRYDLGALLARIEHAARKVNAARISLDAIGAMFNYFDDAFAVRRELYRVACALREMKVTALLTTERSEEHGEVARYGVEEFVADNVIILRNTLEEEKRRRTIEILKFRGTDHQKGEWPFTVAAGEGIIPIPLSAIELTQQSSNARVTSGISGLDGMCGGGFFRDSIVLFSGATGTGKTLASSHFIDSGARNGERALLFALEESRDQLFRNAAGWGMDFAKYEREGNLTVVSVYPESCALEDHLIHVQNVMDEIQPKRVAIDSISALERISTPKGLREFVIGLTSLIKSREVPGLFTSTTPSLLGGSSVTEAHISSITDSIILLRYVEFFGEMRRGLTVLKMRGSAHDKGIREFVIDGQGMHIGRPFRNVLGILSGNFTHVPPDETERLREMFGPETG